MSSKYQIFVSSTYIDLKEQRDQVIKAILEMGHIPVGMEMFSAADEEQWSIIKRQIDQSDYYVVIVANRYGSLASDNISYTEKEYDYAIAQKIPVLGLILDSSAGWPSHHSDTDAALQSLLINFKDKVKQKHVSFWRNTDDLYGKCSIALMKAFTTHPREGWVRASQFTDQKMSGELTRLSAENAALRSELETYRIANDSKEATEFSKIFKILDKNQKEMKVWYKDGSSWTTLDEKQTLFKIFLTVAPEMLIEKSIDDIGKFIAHILCDVSPEQHRTGNPMPSNYIKDWLADFAALGLVHPSSRKKPIQDKNEYWTLSQKGKDLLNYARRLLLEKAIEQK